MFQTKVICGICHVSISCMVPFKIFDEVLIFLHLYYELLWINMNQDIYLTTFSVNTQYQISSKSSNYGDDTCRWRDILYSLDFFQYTVCHVYDKDISRFII